MNSVQRDYMAGEISKDLTARLLLDPEIVKAHNEGCLLYTSKNRFVNLLLGKGLPGVQRQILADGILGAGQRQRSFSHRCLPRGQMCIRDSLL